MRWDVALTFSDTRWGWTYRGRRALRAGLRHRVPGVCGLGDAGRRPRAPRRGAFGAILAAFDTGIGAGSTMSGWLIGRHGFPTAFGLAAALSALALPAFLLSERRFGHSHRNNRRRCRRLVVPNLRRSSRTSRALLAFLLVVAEPAGLALVASGLVTTIGDRGALAVAWLVVRLLITGFGAGVGMAPLARASGIGSADAMGRRSGICRHDDHRAHTNLAAPAASRCAGTRHRLVVRVVRCWFAWTIRTTSSEQRATSSERGAAHDEL